MENSRLAQVEAELIALAARVTALETAVPTPERPLPTTLEVAPGEIDFRLMERLQNRKGDQFDGDGVGGSIVYAGDFRNNQASRAWHVERPVPFLASYDVEPLAVLLSALSHPQRLALVQLLLHGPHDRQQLQTALDISSPGQLYHHLNSLLDTGIIRQQRRGVYALCAKATVPLLVIMAAAVDIGENKTASIEEVSE